MRLGKAIERLHDGAPVTSVGLDHGFESLSGFGDAMKRTFGQAPTEAAKAIQITWTRITTPLGPMIAAATSDHLVLLEFADRRSFEKQCQTVCKRLGGILVPGSNEVLTSAATQISEYFRGARRAFDVPMQTPGTDFQVSLWSELRTIEYGTTQTYAQLADSLGRPDAVRAVGKANGDNRIAIIIPCHRVIGSDGKLTGYAGGLWRKQKLLEMESGQATLW